MRHKPVLLQEILENLKLPKGGVYIDCNLGDGGHTQAVIESLNGDVTAIGFDLDQDAIKRATENISSSSSFNENTKLKLFRKNFRTLKDTLSKEGMLKAKAGAGGESGAVEPIADAILFDLGISSYEIDESGRGFSFQKDEPLSMKLHTSTLNFMTNPSFDFVFSFSHRHHQDQDPHHQCLCNILSQTQ